MLLPVLNPTEVGEPEATDSVRDRRSSETRRETICFWTGRSEMYTNLIGSGAVVAKIARGYS